MKSCNGCKYIINTSFSSLCSHDDPDPEYTTNPYTGREQLVITGYKRPTIQEMRSEKGNCGPEAGLYKPNLIRRIIGILKK